MIIDYKRYEEFVIL